MNTIKLHIKKKRNIVIWLAPLLMITFGAWYFMHESVSMYTPFNKYNNPIPNADKLANLEPRAIPVLIKEIKRHHVNDKGFSHYSNALASFGQNGKEALIHEIDKNDKPVEQFRLIASLQNTFNDYSRLFLWIDKAVSGNYNFMQLSFMRDVVSKTYAEAPSLSDPKKQNSLNPEFREWWMTREVAIDFDTSPLVTR